MFKIAHKKDDCFIRLTLKQQKKRLKETGVRTDHHLNTSQTSLNSRQAMPIFY